MKKHINILIILTTFFVLNQCKIETNKEKLINYKNSVLSRSNYLNGYEIEDIKGSKDTIEFYLVNNKKNYYSDIEFHQSIMYLFQDLSIIEQSNHNHLKIFYKLPLRDSLGFHLMIDNKFSNFVNGLNLFNNLEYKNIVNQLYELDSSYGNRVELVDILNFEFAIAESELNKTEPKLFGVNSQNILYSYLIECKNQDGQHFINLVKKAIENINKRDEYGIGVKNEINEFLSEICEK